MNDTSALLKFLDDSPMSFNAVANVSTILENAGFVRLDSSSKWNLKPGDRRYIVKNGSALFAFIVGSGCDAEGFRIISAHSDSPGFRIKPSAPIMAAGKTMKLNTEVYGGPILYTWFDRPLSIAGRVFTATDDPFNPRCHLVKVDRPLLTIPHLAIHYNRSVNDGNPLSRQKDMLPVLQLIDETVSDGDWLEDAIGIDHKSIIGMELGLYDTTHASIVGMNGEFIQSGRIDDLSMVHAAMTALIRGAGHDMAVTRVMAIFDNEETGSGTKQGAASPVLHNLLRRIAASVDADADYYYRSIDNSFMISADNAHAVHPNYPEKQDPTNHPRLGGGPVIKINANCKYMTDADSAAVYSEICRRAGVPCQYFVNHSDVAGGSTLGNILTSQIDLRGVDMGAAMWGMHSCRETASVADHGMITESFATFYTL